MFLWFLVLSLYMSSVSGIQNKCPNSHHSYPVHLFNTWIYCECKVQNGLISKETLYLLLVWFLDTIFCQWNMFNFGEYAQICHLPLSSLKELHFPWLILKFSDLSYGEWLIFLAWSHMSHSSHLILWGDPKSRYSFRILNRIENRRSAIKKKLLCLT